MRPRSQARALFVAVLVAVAGTLLPSVQPAALAATPTSALSWYETPYALPDQGGVTSVDCPTTTSCEAVDGLGNALHYDGTSWGAPTALEDEPRTSFGHVSCPTTTFCMTIELNGSPVRFDGQRWHASPSNLLVAADGGLSCLSPTFCLTLDVVQGSTFRFNGSTWSQVAQLSDPGHGARSLSCMSATRCVAVDDQGDAATFDGTTWSALGVVDAGQRFRAVSCVPSACVAVTESGRYARFDGTQWSAAAPLTSSLPASPYVTDVSCSSASSCVAVDANNQASWVFDGSTWQQTAMPERASAVHCLSATWCMAVGAKAQTWDGTSWTTLAGDADPDLLPLDVGCGASHCFVSDVGRVVEWDGQRWLSPVRVGDLPLRLSCPSDTFCTAWDGAGRTYRYDGTSWSGPTTVTVFGLTALSCASATFCLAASYLNQGAQMYTWDGASWSGPVAMGNSSRITALSCPSSTFCVAASQDNPSATILTKAYRYDGSGWDSGTVVDDPGVRVFPSCVSATFCVATDDDGRWLEFDGVKWSSPATAGDLSLGGVSCTALNTCLSSSGAQPYRFDGQTWTQEQALPSRHVAAHAKVGCGTPHLCAFFADGNAYVGKTPSATAPVLSLDGYGSSDCTSTADAPGGRTPVTVTLANTTAGIRYVLKDARGRQDPEGAVTGTAGTTTATFSLRFPKLTSAYSFDVYASAGGPFDPSNVLQLTVEGCQGTVHPSDAPPTAVLKAPATGYAPVSLALDASASHDDHGITAWAFSCGNGAANPHGTGSPGIVHCSYTKAGKYTVGLLVQDGSGQRGSATRVLPVGARVPATFDGETITQARSRLYAVGIHPGSNVGGTPPSGYHYAFAYYAFKTSSGYPKVLPGRPIPYGTLVYIVARYVRNT